MNNYFKALLYRNFLLYKNVFIFSMVIILWCFFNFDMQKDMDQLDLPIKLDFFLQFYLLLLIIQFQAMFAHGLIDDKVSQFRNLYKVMGLSKNNYLISQFFSFIWICLFTLTFYTSVLFLNNLLIKKIQEPWKISNTIELFQNLCFIIQSTTFTMIINYVFKSPTIGRDMSALIHFAMIFLEIYIINNKNINILQYILPYYLFLEDQILGIDDDNYSIFKNSIIVLIQFIFSTLIIYYLDNIIPQEDDNQRNLLFFIDDIKKCFLKSEKKQIDMILNKDFENQQNNFNDLEIVDLKKQFDSINVLNNINLKLNKGNLYCLLGHNGAGKSTFVNILTGLYKPTSGQILWKGKDFREIKRTQKLTSEFDIGICPSFDCLYENLTVYQHLKIIGLIKNIQNLEIRIIQILQELNLIEYSKFQTSKLSGGNKRKLSLAISLIGNPSLLFLDEPTSSIDPKSRKDIWEIILKLKLNKDLIIVLTTHHLEEAEILSDQISILSLGEIIVEGTVSQIKNKFGVGFTIDIFPQSNIKQFEQILEEFYQILNLKFENVIKQVRTITINIPIENQNNLENILIFIEQNIPQDFNFYVNSNTLENAYLEIDKKQHQEQNIHFKQEIIDKLYSIQINTWKFKIYLIFKNKISFLITNVIEIIKIIIIILYALIVLYFAKILMEQQKLPLQIYLKYFIIFYVMINISSYSFSTYNIVYEKQNDIKILMHSQKINIFQYYLGKFLVDIFLLCFDLFFLSIGYIYIMGNDLTDKLWIDYYQLLKIIFYWKISNISMSYLYSFFFENCRSVLKYYSLLQMGMLGIIEALIWLTGFQFLNYFSDLAQFIQYFTNKTEKNYQLIFICQLIFYWTIILIKENYNLKFNYVFKNYKAPVKIEKNLVDTKSLKNLYLNTNDFIKKEEQEVNQRKDLFFKGQNLFKEYKTIFRTNNKIAVRNISFGIDKGISFGLVGPNGAGKSTTFGMILNKILKSGGELKIQNKTFKQGIKGLFEQSIFNRINFGISFQGNALWEQKKVKENLNFYSQLNCIREEVLIELIKYFEFENYLNKKVDQLSSGNKRKLCIIISLLNDPTFLLFDEATCGVDIMIRQKLKKIFQYMKQRNNQSSIFTTHFLQDIELFCEKIGIIENGQFLCIDYVQNIKKNLGGYIIKFYELNQQEKQNILQKLDQYGDVEQGREQEQGGKLINHYFLFNNYQIREIIKYLQQLKNQNLCEDFTINQLSIEDIYLNILSE